MLHYRVLKWLGALIVWSFWVTLASANAVGPSIEKLDHFTNDRRVMPDLVLAELRSPLVRARAFASVGPGKKIIEEMSRESVAEPVFTVLAAPANTVSTGTVRALVMYIQISNGLVTNRVIPSPGFQVASDLLRQMSRGMIDVQIEYLDQNIVVDGWNCDKPSLSVIKTKAMKQAEVVLDLDQYRFISFVLPCEQGWFWGEMPGRSTWISAETSFSAETSYLTWYPSAITHEWGHNLSLGHSLAMQCSVNGVPTQFASRVLRDQGACTVGENYQSPFSTMGYGGSGTLTFLERFQLGWLREGEFQTAFQGTWTLSLESAPTLLMLQNSEGDMFAIEYWSAPLLFARFPGRFANGVIVHYVSEYKTDSYTPSGYSVISYVLDMNPSTPPDRDDAALQAGQSFVDPTGTLQIDVTAVDETSATVSVRGLPFRPNMPTGFVVTPQATLGFVDVAWTAVVSASPVTHYEIQISSQRDFIDSTTTKIGITGNTGAVKIPGAKYGKKYWLRVAAVNVGGRSDFAQATTTVNWLTPFKSQTSKSGSACSSAGTATTGGKVKLICTNVGNRLIWKKN